MSRKSRQAKAEAAHIARCRESGSPGSVDVCSSVENSPLKEVNIDQAEKCTAAHRPNPLLCGFQAAGRAQDISQHAPRCREHQCTPMFAKAGEISTNEVTRTTIFNAVLEEKMTYLDAFGDADSDDEVCSFAGSDGDRVTDLCEKAENLIRELGASVTTFPVPPASTQVPVPQISCGALPTSTPVVAEEDEENPSLWPGPQPCQSTDALFQELRSSCSTHGTVQASSAGDEEAKSTFPGLQPCDLEASIAEAVRCNVLAPACDNVLFGAMENDATGIQDEPSSWPDLQPWLRGMCSSAPFASAANGASHDKGSIQLDDLQFRVSRLELQVSPTTSGDEQVSVNQQLAGLRKDVENAQAELLATRREAQEVNDQLRFLMQHVGTALGTSDMSNPSLHGVGGVFRSLSVCSQDSQVVHRAPSVQSSAVDSSPVPMPRARSLDTVARRGLYPLAGPGQPNPQRNLQSSTSRDKASAKRHSYASLQPGSKLNSRVGDVPVRMCTSQQLMQTMKQKPLRLLSTPDAFCSRPGKIARPQLSVLTSSRAAGRHP